MIARFTQLVLFTGLVSILILAQTAENSRANSPQSKTLPEEYRHWIDEDVVYISSSQERQAFHRSKTSTERDKFIEQFWKRRDPTPSTARNEFKEEHYRRIAYANVNLSDAVPGWKTDRGRIYIMQGPPTSIRRNNGGPHTEEIWRYDTSLSAPRVYTFVDECNCGQFKLKAE